jgi:hypothetical protein
MPAAAILKLGLHCRYYDFKIQQVSLSLFETFHRKSGDKCLLYSIHLIFQNTGGSHLENVCTLPL